MIPPVRDREGREPVESWSIGIITAKPENGPVLIGLLNAILRLPSPIVHAVTLDDEVEISTWASDAQRSAVIRHFLLRRMTDGGSGFFSLAQRGGRWWLIAPDDEPFFSLGLNHIDPSPLRYLANGDLWQRKYGNSMERWLKESVAPDLRQGGFNSVGWTQEVVTRGLTKHRHCRVFTFEEYQWHRKTGKPVLLADHAVSLKQPDGSLRIDVMGDLAFLAVRAY